MLNNGRSAVTRTVPRPPSLPWLDTHMNLYLLPGGGSFVLRVSTTLLPRGTHSQPPLCALGGRRCRQEPPAYVIGPAAHVGHALNALVGFHTNSVEATVINVMDSAMVGALSIRRAEAIGNVLTKSQLYEVLL